MTWVVIAIVVFSVWLLISGSRSERKSVDFYRRFYSREELESLRDEHGSDMARRALEDDR